MLPGNRLIELGHSRKIILWKQDYPGNRHSMTDTLKTEGAEVWITC